jgi:hypothetical protein
MAPIRRHLSWSAMNGLISGPHSRLQLSIACANQTESRGTKPTGSVASRLLILRDDIGRLRRTWIIGQTHLYPVFNAGNPRQ